MTKVHTKRCIVKIYLFLLPVLLACGEYEPDNPGPPYCADPPIVNILDFLPSIHNVSLSGTVFSARHKGRRVHHPDRPYRDRRKV